MSILKIRKQGETQWTEIADPVSLQWSLTDGEGEDGSGKNQMGLTFRDRITQKRELSCSWGPLEDDKMSRLLSCFNDNFFELEYPDALSGERLSGTFYVSARQSPMYRYHADAEKWLWSGMSASLTER